jgi:hypothetical protein
MSVGTFAFLPNLRSGAAASANLEGVRARVDYELELIAAGTAEPDRIAVGATLRGPGDVVGIDPTQIRRIEPEAVNRGFEPNYFPFVEFKDPDLPWRYSLGSGTQDQLMPWIVLIALRDDEFTDLFQGDAFAPVIEVGSVAASLPDLGTAWASAHVQVDMSEAMDDPASVVEADPGRAFSRLFALRKLDDDTHYTLFLVPSYAIGRTVALGQASDPDLGTTLAWDAASSSPLALPYFHRHRFRTEAGQDLETLLRQLRGLETGALGDAGAPLVVSAENVGYYDTVISPGASFEAQAALRRPGEEVPGYDTPEPLAGAIKTTLDSVLTDTEGDEDEDPLVTFPAYGQHVTSQTDLSLARAGTGHWFDRLNLDLKFRAVAGLGQEIVRRNDEHFAALCWDQYGTILAANQELLRLQVAEQLARILDQRHFSRLPAEAGLQLGEPLLTFTRIDATDGASASIGKLLSDKKVPNGFASLALRRAVARKPVRRKPTGPGPSARRRPPLAAFPGDTTPDPRGVRRKEGMGQRRAAQLRKDESRGDIDNALRQLFNVEYLGRKARPRQPEPQVGQYESKKIHRLLGAKLAGLPRAKSAALISGRTEAEEEAGGIVYRSPRVPEPLIDYLRRFNGDAILSNAATLPDNTVSFYEENRHFVEAILAGANHAMNEELRWRGYPTDLRGTIFPRFWNRGADAFDISHDDISAMHRWTGKLGSQHNPADQDGKANVVVVIKGEVVRKLKDPIVEISIATGKEWKPATAESHPPVYFGKIGEETVYYGYDVSRDDLLDPDIRDKAYLAIYEPPGRLRFGLDVGSETVRRTRPRTPAEVLVQPAPPLETWDDLSWKHMQLTASDHVDVTHKFPRPSLEQDHWWGETKHAAGLARSFWQKPLAALLPLMRVI